MNIYRADCRFYSQISGVKSCVASVTYRKYGKEMDDFRLGVACDYETIFSGPAILQSQQIADRVSPRSSAFPALEVPSETFRTTGTYQAMLDTFVGRLVGTCYVRPAHPMSMFTSVEDLQ